MNISHLYHGWGGLIRRVLGVSTLSEALAPRKGEGGGEHSAQVQSWGRCYRLRSLPRSPFSGRAWLGGSHSPPRQVHETERENHVSTHTGNLPDTRPFGSLTVRKMQMWHLCGLMSSRVTLTENCGGPSVLAGDLPKTQPQGGLRRCFWKCGPRWAASVPPASLLAKPIPCPHPVPPSL